MPIANVKLAAPTYDSDKDSPPFSEFHDMFLNFVDYQEHGRCLIAVAMHALGRTFDPSPGFTPAGMEGGLLLGDAELAELDEALASADVRPLVAYSELTFGERQLDKDLYSVLSQCITGKHRATIANVQFRSFIQAWVRLVTALGANNIQRKADLLTKLQKLEFRGDVSLFKTEATQTITDLINSHVTLEDVMMHSIISALPSELMALRVMQAAKLNDSAKTTHDVFEFIDTTASTLEIAGMGTKFERTNVLSIDAGTSKARCTRCGRNNHGKTECFARRHADGSRLTSKAPKLPPSKPFVAAEEKCYSSDGSDAC